MQFTAAGRRFARELDGVRMRASCMRMSTGDDIDEDDEEDDLPDDGQTFEPDDEFDEEDFDDDFDEDFEEDFDEIEEPHNHDEIEQDGENERSD